MEAATESRCLQSRTPPCRARHRDRADDPSRAREPDADARRRPREEACWSQRSMPQPGFTVVLRPVHRAARTALYQ